MTVVRRTPLHIATVVDVVRLTPRMRRITVSAPTLAQPRPAQDVELVLTDAGGRKVKRRYTITHYRDGHFDIDALLHGTAAPGAAHGDAPGHAGAATHGDTHGDTHGEAPGAPGATWAANAAPGEQVQFFGPRGRLDLRAADWHLFVGDESALPAIAELATAVPASAYALLEVGDASDEVPLAADVPVTDEASHAAGASPDIDVRWLHRGATPAGTVPLLADAIEAFTPPPGTGHAYAMGESRVVAALRPRLQALGIPNERLYIKGYWNVGRLAAAPAAAAGTR